MKLTRKQWMMLVVLVLGAFVTVLNQTLVTPALPSIMTEMNVDQSTAQWLTTGFTLVNAIMIPITAFLQDRFSTRKLFVFSMSLFAVGTLLAAVGLNFPVLLGGRLVQAAGAGILMPVTMTVLMLVFPVDRRGSAMGIFGLVIAFAPAIGPTVAGFVIDQADWHILFYLIFALSIVIIVPSLFLVDNKAPANKGDSVLDPLSLALSTLGFGLMLYGFSALGSAGFTLVPLLTTALGIVGVVWVLHPPDASAASDAARRRAEEPPLPRGHHHRHARAGCASGRRHPHAHLRAVAPWAVGHGVGPRAHARRYPYGHHESARRPSGSTATAHAAWPSWA